MFIEKFISKHFISFYKVHKYKLLYQEIRDSKILKEEYKEFENEEEIKNYINSILEEYNLVYISTIIISVNQSVVDSCSKTKYTELGIDLENIKSICINNQYSFYTSIYEISEIKNIFEYIDFIYPVFAIIDFLKKDTNNTLYFLSIEDFYAVLVYFENKGIYSEIFFDEEVEDISSMEIDQFGEFDEDLGDLMDIDEIEDIEEVKEEEVKENDIAHMHKESAILKNIRTSIKDYYSQGKDFIEKIYIFSDEELDSLLAEVIKDELFIDVEIIKVDILEIINKISIKNV